jgi:hypothetical protein
MTLTDSNGLEAEHVFILGLNAGNLPGPRSWSELAPQSHRESGDASSTLAARGPGRVSSSRHRAHLEVKKLHNGKFWNGLAEQLPTYLRSDEVTDGWLLVIQYRTGKPAEERIRQLPKKIAAVSESRTCNLRHAIVDARRPKPASKL